MNKQGVSEVAAGASCCSWMRDRTGPGQPQSTLHQFAQLSEFTSDIPLNGIVRCSLAINMCPSGQMDCWLPGAQAMLPA